MTASNKPAEKPPPSITPSLAQELLTPLQAMLGHTDMLEATELSPEQRGLLDVIRRTGQSLQALVSALAELTTPDRGRTSVTQREFDLHETVEDTAASLVPAAYAKGLELITMVYRDVPTRLYGDPVRLHQVLSQLLTLSIQRGTQGSVALRVMLDSETAERAVLRITISDGGTPSNELTATAVMTRRLIDLLGGQLETEGGTGALSGFSFLLPLDKPAKASAALPWPGLVGQQIRLIDNNLLFRQALTHHLELWGARVVQQGALANLTLGAMPVACDVVILGLRPQEMQQPEIIPFLGQCKAHGIPVLTLVASLEEETHRRLRELGVTASLPKSVNRLTLYRVLCRLAGAVPSSEERRLDLHDLPVLVADDVLANRRLMKVLLEQLGARPALASGGEEAIAEWRCGRHRLVLMDIRMPDLDGAAVARQIRSLEQPGEACVIVGITAALDAPLRRQLLDAGMNDCILKPTDHHSLMRDLKPWVMPLPEWPESRAPGAEATIAGAVLAPEPVAQLARSHSVLQQNPELLQLLVEALPLQLAGLEQAVSGNDLATIREELHQLQGTAAFYRLSAIRDKAGELQKSLKKDGLLLNDSLLPLKQVVNAVLHEIRAAQAKNA